MSDHAVEKLLLGYAAPKPRAEFIKRLGDELGDDLGKELGKELGDDLGKELARGQSAQTPGRSIWRPAVLAASVVLAVTFTLVALRPEARMTRPGPLIAQAGQGEPTGTSPQVVVQNWMRWAEADPVAPFLGWSGRGSFDDTKLGELPEAFFYEQPAQADNARQLFFAWPRPKAPTADKPRPKLKEPEYQSNAPRYGLLVFGPDAKTRVWVVLDLVSEPYDPKGNLDALYVDRNGNGDLTEPDERVPVVMKEHKYVPFVSFAGYQPKEVTHYIPTFRIGELVERDGRTRHMDVAIEVGEYVGQLRACKVSVKVNGRDERMAWDRLLRFSKQPEDAPIIHFNGPLAMSLSMESGAIFVPVNYEGGEWDPPRREAKHLLRGQEMQLYAEVGTPGVGAGSFLSLTANVPPKDAHPVAEVEFPHRDPKQPPIRVRVVLKDRC